MTSPLFCTVKRRALPQAFRPATPATPRDKHHGGWLARGGTIHFFSNHCSILRRLDMTSRWIWNIFELGPLQLKIAGKVAESMWQLCLGYSLRLNTEGQSFSLTRGVRMQKRGQAMHWTFAWPNQLNAKWGNEVYPRYVSLRLNRWRIFGFRSRANVPFPHVPQAAQSPIQLARGTVNTSRWKRVILDTTGSFAYSAWDILVALRTTQTMIFTNLLWEHDRFRWFFWFCFSFLGSGPAPFTKKICFHRMHYFEKLFIRKVGSQIFEFGTLSALRCAKWKQHRKTSK